MPNNKMVMFQAHIMNGGISLKTLSNTAIDKAGKIGEAIMEVLKATSVQFAASYKGEIVASRSVGKYDMKESRPLSNTDIYGVGSTSKAFVTAAAMLLVDQGLLDIDKPYKDYVPQFEMADPRYTQITARHLMNHSSGIFGTHFRGGFLFEDNDTFAHDTLLNSLKVCRLKHNPGDFSEYCNDGFQLLELLVEQISGLSYTAFLHENFFAPLGIQNIKTSQDKYDLSQMAKYAIPEIFDGDLPYETVNLIGTGGISATAEDLCRFGRVLMGKAILSEQSAQMMGAKEYANSLFWPEDEEDDNLFAYGLGYDHVHVPPFDKVGLSAWCKGGDTMQYHASLIVIPELDLAAASLSAGGASFANYCLIIELLKDICLEFGLVEAFPEAKTYEAPVAQPVPEDILKYQGLYAERGKFADIKIVDDAIELDALLAGLIPGQKYIYVGDGKFVSPDGKGTLFFVEAQDGLTFLQGNLLIELPGVGAVNWKAFQYQRLEKNPLSDAVAAAWKARADKKYIIVNSMISSLNYLTFSEPSIMKLPVSLDYGYVAGGAKIVDENYAENTMYFRDVFDYAFHTEGGTEYLSASGQIYIDTAVIPALKASDATVTIGAKGYTQFFNVGDNLAGKTLSVKLPEGGLYGAYGEEKEGAPRPLKVLTNVTGNKPAELATGDMLAFAGQPGDTFTFELK